MVHSEGFEAKRRTASNPRAEILKQKSTTLLKVMLMVHSEGFEPSTPRAEIWYSIQLNYECIRNVNIVISM
jgi:hypothetical protein